jgi:antitoxin ParD1/3/4
MTEMVFSVIIRCEQRLDYLIASLNVSLPDPMRNWVQKRVESGHYASIGDYLRDLVSRDQMRADEHDAVVAALIEGEKSGSNKRRIPEILAALRQAGIAAPDV